MLGSAHALWSRIRLGRGGRYVRLPHNRVYYETYGRGKPLLLLHGGMSTVRTFRCQVSALARHFRVILPERTGHGHTQDLNKPLHYEQMAEETAAFCDALGLKRVQVVGYSDGANLVFYLARMRPELIEKFVCIGGNFHHAGCSAVFAEEMRALPRDSVGEGIDEEYARISPDGAGHYAEIFYKVRQLWLNEPALSLEQVAEIAVPTLVMAGDRDVVTLEHTQSLFEALPKAQLAVLPGCTHRVIKEQPALVNALLLRFLRNPFPEPVADALADATA